MRFPYAAMAFCLAILGSIPTAEAAWTTMDPPQSWPLTWQNWLLKWQRDYHIGAADTVRLQLRGVSEQLEAAERHVALLEDQLRRPSLEAGQAADTVLSLDGGGERGLLEVRALMKLEELTGMPISTLFNVFTGNSTGSIIVAAITLRDPATGAPAYTAEGLLSFYEDDGAAIFPHPDLNHAISLDGFRRPIYPHTEKTALLHRYLGTATFAEAIADAVVIPAGLWSDEAGFRARVYTSRHDSDLPIAVAADASSNAPIYFPLLQDPTTRDRVFQMDGGMFANNPSVFGYAAARRRNPDGPLPMVVSIGTGALVTPPPENIENAGAIKLLGPLLSGIMLMRQQAATWTLDEILGRGDKHHRIQFRVDHAHEAMDRYDAEQLAYLNHVFDTYYAEHEAAFVALAKRLRSNALLRMAASAPVETLTLNVAY